MTTRTTRLRRAVLASCAALGTAVAFVAYAEPAQAATGSVTLNRGVLAVQGDSGRNAFVVGRTTTGVITLNGAEVLGGTATTADVSLVVLDGGGGDDNMRVDESNGAMPAAHLIGDAGNDQLSGGSGADELFGGDGVDSIDAGRGDDTILAGLGNDKVAGGFGADVVLLGDDSDQFTWNPGDGSDFVEGEGGTDTLLFNGSAASELLDVDPDGDYIRIARNVGGVVMRVAGLELVKTNLSRGQDLVQVGDLTGTGTNHLQISFAPLSSPDDRSDTVVVAGTSAADRIRVGGPSPAGAVTVSGLRATVLVTGAGALAVRGLAGDDGIDAARLSAGAVALTETGDSGNDILIGTPGNDTLLGSSGNDRLEGRGGTDALDGGPGDNVIIP